jgi:hypothetical protein
LIPPDIDTPFILMFHYYCYYYYYYPHHFKYRLWDEQRHVTFRFLSLVSCSKSWSPVTFIFTANVMISFFFTTE